MARDVALAIGVSDARPLANLPGALSGARAFHEWASRLGYDSRLLTDEDEPVTIPRLRTELEGLLNEKLGPIHRLLLYFAGHGLIRDAEEGLWLLSDWRKELKAVVIPGLKRRLFMHNIQQIAIFADSCRSLPADLRTLDLELDKVLGLGPYRSDREPKIDQFIAAADGDTALMIPGKNPEDDRCLFSGVLMEGLWGAQPQAFSKVVKGKITSRSLGAFLESAVPERANQYKQKLFPRVYPSFPEDDDIYFGPEPPPEKPVFPPWPSPSAVVLLEAVAVIKSFESITHVTSHGRSFEDVLPSMPEPAPPDFLERLSEQKRPSRFETRAGFAAEGAAIVSCWTRDGVEAEPHGSANWWRIGLPGLLPLQRPEPVLIEFDDGTFAAVTALPDFIATILRGERGISALIYRKIDQGDRIAAGAEAAIAQMEAGTLRVDAAIDLAVGLRHDKHADPVMGVISAYLYDSIDDVDSIRRMAYYYAKRRQAIPYEIALLGRLRGERRDGLLWVNVPAVKQRRPRSKAEEQHAWTYEKTPKSSGVVGGLWPWMRQGWMLLDDPVDDGSPLIAPGLIDLIRHLRPGRFTLLDAEGGRALAKLFNLSPRQQLLPA